MKKYNCFISVAKWFAGFFQDQKGVASRKAAVLYTCLFFMYRIINGSMNGKKTDDTVTFYVFVIILFCIGAITAEFFKNFPVNSKSTTTTKETSIEVDKKENNQ